MSSNKNLEYYDKGAETRWLNARHAYNYYQSYINSKRDKHLLTVVDLLYVKNFKGGASTITEPQEELHDKLQVYSKSLNDLLILYDGTFLQHFSKEEVNELSDQCFKFICLTKNDSLRIRGFGVSFASALLNAYLPNVVPILDRRVLNGMGNMHVSTNLSGQVKNIENHFRDLILYFHKTLSNGANRTLEDLDFELFKKHLEYPYRGIIRI